ncbi:unnamed protein product [Cylicocyclus nassatus]|uniref:Uncharacterized protein n=1 Tax=Cylicocyclus nassatus TaxID=53992 RepID=A0AA36GK05_CYLNA|nr:unnamed protein product [Cylicocyclus nassatus]
MAMSAESSDSDSMVQELRSDHSSSCTPSTSGASSPCHSVSRRRKDKMRKQASRSRYLLAIEDRNRLRKLAARKVRIASNTISATTFLRWKEKIDRKFEKQFEKNRGNLKRLQQENEMLRAHRRTFIEGCNALKSCAVMLQMRLEQQLDSSPEFDYSSSHDFFFPHS